MVTGCSVNNNGGDCNVGLNMFGVGSVIGNVVLNNNSSGTTGFLLGTGNIVVDRNSADGNGTNYVGGPANRPTGGSTPAVKPHLSPQQPGRPGGSPPHFLNSGSQV